MFCDTDANTASSLGVGSEEVSIVIIQQGGEGGDIVLQTGGGQVLTGTSETEQTPSQESSNSTPPQLVMEQSTNLSQQLIEPTEREDKSSVQNENQSGEETLKDAGIVTSSELDSLEESDNVTDSRNGESRREKDEEGQLMLEEGEDQSENSQDEAKKPQKPQIIYLNKKPRRAGKKNNMVVVYSCGVCMKKFSSKGVYSVKQ